MPVTLRNTEEIRRALDTALAHAGSDATVALPANVDAALLAIHGQVDSGTTGFTNLVTCLAAAAVDPDVDPRYHRFPRRGMPAPPTGRDYHSGRSISERVVYPWLEDRGFRTARSGWQTRVFERPAPYDLSYPENIRFYKNEFLLVLDRVAARQVAPGDVLCRLFELELAHRDSLEGTRDRVVALEAPTHSEPTIEAICDALEEQFTLPGAARLPVFAVHAVYGLMLPQISRFAGAELLPLQEHAAADVRTHSLGDVEVVRGQRFEVVEVKHGITFTEDHVRAVVSKLTAAGSRVPRYYLLTTAPNPFRPSAGLDHFVDVALESLGCQVIINGVVSTVRYYLRLSSEPVEFLRLYSDHLIASATGALIDDWEERLAQLGYRRPEQLVGEDV